MELNNLKEGIHPCPKETGFLPSKRIKGLRLNIRKAPKIEVPKNVYSRKLKHKKVQNEV